MGELIGELNIVWKTSGTSTAFKQTLFFFTSSAFLWHAISHGTKLIIISLVMKPWDRHFYLDVLILKFGEANSCWTELANFLSLDATTIAAILKLNNRDVQSKLADSKCLWKEEIQKASHPYIIKY